MPRGHLPLLRQRKQTAFACPKAASRSVPTHKKGKHGLWYCKNDLLRASLNFYNTKVNKAPAAHGLSIASLLSAAGQARSYYQRQEFGNCYCARLGQRVKPSSQEYLHRFCLATNIAKALVA